jgi:hypothetical protein
MYKIKTFFRRIWNIIRWIPILWKDRWDDYYYLLSIIEYKLKRIASSKDKFERIDLLIGVLPILKEGYNVMHDYYESDINFVEVEGEEHEGEKLYSIEVIMIEDNLEEFLSLHKSKTRQVRKLYPDEDNYHVAMHVTRLVEEQAKRVFFGNMSKYYDSWWI